MFVPKTLEEIQQMIANGIEESIGLDYKAADALQNTDGKKKEIAKDVSAMANSAGGIIIYGIKEFSDDERRHLPEGITPIHRDDFSKEQLEQIISNNISPKIEGLRIYPIALSDPNEVVYVVEIPQSHTAHQNTRDKRYYKRYNFESVAMDDYEIRDIMNRFRNPVIELEFSIEKTHVKINNGNSRRNNKEQIKIVKESELIESYLLKVVLVNKGNVYAQYVDYYIELPEDVVSLGVHSDFEKTTNGYVKIYGENAFKEVETREINPIYDFHKNERYAPSRFDPILPGLKSRPKRLLLTTNLQNDRRILNWAVYADNASPKMGTVRLNEIPLEK